MGWKQAAAIAVVVAACGGKTLPPRFEAAKTQRDDAADRFLAASTAHDSAAITAMLADEVTYGGLWFPDTECRRTFAVAGKIHGPGLGALAACLAPITLQRSVHTHPYPNVAVFTYEPGIEIEVMFELASSKIRWIGYAGRRADDALPSVTDAALMALRIDPASFELDPSTQKQLDGEYAERYSDAHAAPPNFHAWFKLCIDATGGLTGVHPYAASSMRTRDAFAAVVRTWRFKPFVLGEQPTPVCALVSLDLPNKTADDGVFPFPAPAEHPDAVFVSPKDVGDPVVGSRMVIPSDHDKEAMGMAGIAKITAKLNYCIGTDGKVDWVQFISQTEFPGYNAKLQDAISAWQFKPPAEPLCTVVMFSYSQR